MGRKLVSFDWAKKKVSGNNDNLETPTYFIFHIKEDKTRDIASKNML